MANLKNGLIATLLILSITFVALEVKQQVKNNIKEQAHFYQLQSDYNLINQELKDSYNYQQNLQLTIKYLDSDYGYLSDEYQMLKDDYKTLEQKHANVLNNLSLMKKYQ